MSRRNEKYTINPEIGKMINVESSIWKPLAAMYYMIGDQFTDQVIPNPRVYTVSKVIVNRLPVKRVANSTGWSDISL